MRVAAHPGYVVRFTKESVLRMVPYLKMAAMVGVNFVLACPRSALALARQVLSVALTVLGVPVKLTQALEGGALEGGALAQLAGKLSVAALDASKVPRGRSTCAGREHTGPQGGMKPEDVVAQLQSVSAQLDRFVEVRAWVLRARWRRSRCGEDAGGRRAGRRGAPHRPRDEWRGRGRERAGEHVSV